MLCLVLSGTLHVNEYNGYTQFKEKDIFHDLERYRFLKAWFGEIYHLFLEYKKTKFSILSSFYSFEIQVSFFLCILSSIYFCLPR